MHIVANLKFSSDIPKFSSKEKNNLQKNNAVKYFLSSLKIAISYDLLIEVKLNEKGKYEVTKKKPNLQKKIIVKSGKVNSSLFVDGNRIGIPQRVLAELIRIYSFDIDCFNYILNIYVAKQRNFLSMF